RVPKTKQSGADVEEVRVHLLETGVGVDVEPFPRMGDEAHHRAQSGDRRERAVGSDRDIRQRSRCVTADASPVQDVAGKFKYCGIGGSSTEPPTPAPNVVLVVVPPVMAVEPATHGPGTQLSVWSVKNRWSPNIS